MTNCKLLEVAFIHFPVEIRYVKANSISEEGRKEESGREPLGIIWEVSIKNSLYPFNIVPTYLHIGQVRFTEDLR